MASTTDKSTSAKRFELPKLNFDFSSLTDGTDIPPPPESPVEKVPTLPKTPTAAGKKQGDAAKDNNKANGATGGSQAANGSSVSGTERQADEAPPLSPAPSSRAGSIRRFLSTSLLNHSYAESETQSTNGGGGRPVSRSDGSVLDEKKAKRSSGFFRRLRTGDAAKRSSTVYEDPARSQSKPEIRGPPAPMIPELSALQSKLDVNDSGSLGDDLFKDIK
ncbi:hypothetical protein SODALDRAFT_380040 [Sodiomyces alkalinus F11]|uniref:Uncharacterized protein n=1 Tax=Sodiomyces alkalinus (strain CBS 110278 / VKM F-3762 / F11) TaxID=1314773 RepID=A0A3N2PSU8_SODAK|nr:hypothetical protein SODALDRAFT_380040 [Sodiomyces alkalinus F11]ROT37592.1 hypothetical protein SODALDRAFT_380040 [Sodiomyces alkalinus F11]